MVALSPATEAQLRAACLDVAAMGQGCPVTLTQWNGQCADVVIAECDDVYGGLVCALAIRSRSRIVRVSAAPWRWRSAATAASSGPSPMRT